MYIYIFIIHRVKARAIPCLHHQPTRDDNTVSVAQGGTATPGATKQLLVPDRAFKRIIYIYICTPDQLTAVVRSSSFLVQFLFPFVTKIEGTKPYGFVGEEKGAVML